VNQIPARNVTPCVTFSQSQMADGLRSVKITTEKMAQVQNIGNKEVTDRPYILAGEQLSAIHWSKRNARYHDIIQESFALSIRYAERMWYIYLLAVHSIFRETERLRINSADGYIYHSKDSDAYILKIARHRDAVYMLYQECYVGLYLNKLRRYTPNFMYVYGFVTCELPIELPSGKIVYCLNNENKSEFKQYIINENVIDGVTLQRFISRCQTYGDYAFLLEVLLQIYISLDIAWKKYRYSHNDLHAANVLIQTGPLQNIVYGDGTMIATRHVAKIIDYGRSYINADEGPVINPYDHGESKEYMRQQGRSGIEEMISRDVVLIFEAIAQMFDRPGRDKHFCTLLWKNCFPIYPNLDNYLYAKNAIAYFNEMHIESYDEIVAGLKNMCKIYSCQIFENVPQPPEEDPGIVITRNSIVDFLAFPSANYDEQQLIISARDLSNYLKKQYEDIAVNVHYFHGKISHMVNEMNSRIAKLSAQHGYDELNKIVPTLFQLPYSETDAQDFVKNIDWYEIQEEKLRREEELEKQRRQQKNYSSSSGPYSSSSGPYSN